MGIDLDRLIEENAEYDLFGPASVWTADGETNVTFTFKRRDA